MPFWKAARALLRPHPGFPFLCCSKTDQKQTQNDVFMSQKQLLAPVLILQQPGVSGKCWEQHRDFSKHASNLMGLSWHSEKLRVLLFHSGGQEEAFYTMTPTLPCRTPTGALQMGTPKPTPFSHRASTNKLLLIPLRVCGIPSAHLVAEWKHPTTLPQRANQVRAEPALCQAEALGAFCRSRERTAVERFLQQTQLFTWENAVCLAQSILAEVFTGAPLWTRTAQGFSRWSEAGSGL